MKDYKITKSNSTYRVRPNESMRAGQKYRGHLVIEQKAIQKEDGWYWRLKFGNMEVKKWTVRQSA